MLLLSYYICFQAACKAIFPYMDGFGLIFGICRSSQHFVTNELDWMVNRNLLYEEATSLLVPLDFRKYIG